jgi:hypothetical protein
MKKRKPVVTERSRGQEFVPSDFDTAYLTEMGTLELMGDVASTLVIHLDRLADNVIADIKSCESDPQDFDKAFAHLESMYTRIRDTLQHYKSLSPAEVVAKRVKIGILKTFTEKRTFWWFVCINEPGKPIRALELANTWREARELIEQQDDPSLYSVCSRNFLVKHNPRYAKNKKGNEALAEDIGNAHGYDLAKGL